MNSNETRKRIQSAADRSSTYLGTKTSVLGVEEDVTVHDTDRLTHVLNVGPTGYGKTQTLLHVALQDAYKGHGVCIINPKGGLIDEFIAKLPEERWNDVLYINPANDDSPSINVLRPYTDDSVSQAQRENQREIIVSDLVDLFRRQSQNWGDQFGRYLETLLRAHINLNICEDAGKTLVDVYQCVIDTDRLTDVIDRLEDPFIREEVVNIKEDATSHDLEPLKRRLQDFMINSAVRRVIAGDPGLNIKQAVEQQKIILVDVQKGEIGGTVSELVGSTILTQIWAAIQSRVTQTETERTPYYVFIDELQNFTGEDSSLATILSEAREYKLGCWLATQYLQQLSTDLRQAVTNNTGTKIVFNPSGSEDINRLTGMLPGIQKHQLRNLTQYRAAVKMPGGIEVDTEIIDTYPPWYADRTYVEEIKERQTAASHEETHISPSLGRGRNSGSEKHRELLEDAKQHLDDRGFDVTLLYQETGAEKPDGRVQLPNGETAHLEAELSTLSKPAKVIKNYLRASEQGREVLFIVENGNASKLANILEDPVNRNGDEFRDENGSYTYYVDEDGTPFTETGYITSENYRILEITDKALTIYEPGETVAVSGEEQQEVELDDDARQVLQCIADGKDDVYEITSSTDIPNHKVNYRFEKLEKLGLIEVENPGGRVTRFENGTKKNFEAPKEAALTSKGRNYLASRTP